MFLEIWSSLEIWWRKAVASPTTTPLPPLGISLLALVCVKGDCLEIVSRWLFGPFVPTSGLPYGFKALPENLVCEDSEKTLMRQMERWLWWLSEDLSARNFVPHQVTPLLEALLQVILYLTQWSIPTVVNDIIMVVARLTSPLLGGNGEVGCICQSQAVESFAMRYSWHLGHGRG